MLIKKTKSMKLRKLLVIGIAAALLSGCGFNPEKVETTTVQILEDGTLTQIVVDDFDKDYYDFDEFSKMASSEVTAFNIANGENSAVIKDIIRNDDSVKTIMTFDSDDDYMLFNGTTFFYGTVNEMLDAGFSLPGDMVSRDGDAIDADTFYDKEEQHVIVVSEKINIVAPYKIEYMSSGTELVNSKEADLSNVSDSLVYLLLVK